MAVFWILATLMVAVALAFVLLPMLRARPRAAPSRESANLEILRAQRREIEADVAQGLLPADSRDEALAELVARADADLVPQAPATVAARKPWILAGIVFVLVPTLVFGIYFATGNPTASDDKLVASMADPKPDDARILQMVENLARKVKERPDDPQGVALLARSLSAIGRFQESADAYERLAKLVPNDAQVLADYADSLGMAQGRTLAGKPYELVRRALEIDPKNSKALALAGTAAMDTGDYAAATGYWQRLASELPPDSPDQEQIKSIVREIQARASVSGKPIAAAASTAAPAKAPVAAADAGKSIIGSVSLAFGVSGAVKGGETLFIFARTEGGPRMPLAIIRASASQLPFKFALDDSQAMAPTHKLSGAAAVRIEARISKSGNAMPQPGDLVGTSGVVKPGARDVNVVVDKVIQ